MIREIYARSLGMLMKQPVRLWGLSLLGGFLTFLGNVFFGIIPAAGVAISWLLTVGMVGIYVRGIHGEEVYAVQLFDAFRDWKTIKRVLAGTGWAALWVFLWALIPVVGIIFALVKAYSYQLVPYILLYEPEVAPTDAIKVSAERTMGYKGKLFWADVLPVVLYVVAVLIFWLCSNIPGVGVVFNILGAVVSILFCLLLPLFLGLVGAMFYEKLTPAPEAQTEEE